MKLLPSYGVITACRNSARTIGRTVDSVLRQGVLPSQYVFVDGGSTDGTLEIIREMQTRHTQQGGAVRFSLLHQGNTPGIAGAWNIGLEHTSSDIVFILNSDDWYEENCAETVLNVMADNADVGMVVANEWVYKRGESTPCGQHRNRPAWLMPVAMSFVHPACFVRRSVYKQHGFFDVSLEVVLDYEFLYRCLRGGVKFRVLDETLVNFELGGTANTRRAEARLEMYRSARRYCPFPILPFGALLLRYLTGR